MPENGHRVRDWAFAEIAIQGTGEVGESVRRGARVGQGGRRQLDWLAGLACVGSPGAVVRPAQIEMASPAIAVAPNAQPPSDEARAGVELVIEAIGNRVRADRRATGRQAIGPKDDVGPFSSTEVGLLLPTDPHPHEWPPLRILV